MKAARLQGRLGEALQWCEEQGVTSLLMLQEEADRDELVKALGLKPMPAKFLKQKLVEWVSADTDTEAEGGTGAGTGPAAGSKAARKRPAAGGEGEGRRGKRSA